MIAPLLLALTCVWTLLTSCARSVVPPEQRQLEATIAEMLKDRDEVVIRAEQIAPFPWQSLCFEREQDVQLIFEDGGSKLTMKFAYEKVFIDEAYVAASPAKRCVTRQTRLRLKRIYPAHAETIGIYLEQK